MFDSTIIGAGPAGISAAVYIRRAGFYPLVVHDNTSALLKADRIENYYGTQSASGEELLTLGIEKAVGFGVKVIESQAVGAKLEQDGCFTVKTTTGEFKSKTLIIATGAAKKTAEIPNLKAFEGKGVSYCAVCDAFFYRDKTVCVLGSGEYALSELKELKSFAKKLFLLTNGGKPEAVFSDGIEVITEEISALIGENKFEGVKFKTGKTITADGLFIALGTAGATEFAKELGIILEEDGKIAVDADMKTSLKGVFAAGDCVGGVLQVAVAVGEGAKAGLTAIEYLRAITK